MRIPCARWTFAKKSSVSNTGYIWGLMARTFMKVTKFTCSMVALFSLLARARESSREAEKVACRPLKRKRAEAESNYHAFFISEPEDVDGKAMEANDQKYVDGASEHNASAHTMQDMPPVLLPEDLWPDIICFVAVYYAESFGHPYDLLENGRFHYWCALCAGARMRAANSVQEASERVEECIDFDMRIEDPRDARGRLHHCEKWKCELDEEIRHMVNRCACEDCGGFKNCEECAAVRTLRAVSTKFQSMTDDPF